MPWRKSRRRYGSSWQTQPAARRRKQQRHQFRQAKKGLRPRPTRAECLRSLTKQEEVFAASAKKRPEAILLGAFEATGKNYAAILTGLWTGESLREVGENMRRVRRAQSGALLLELKKGKQAVEMCRIARVNVADTSQEESRHNISIRPVHWVQWERMLYIQCGCCTTNNPH